MNSPNCPDHGRTVLDLALGRLDDEAALEAENISESCPICRAWWMEQFEGEAAQVVDEAVAATFTDLTLPRQRRSHGWMAAAAAVVMALGVGTIWVARSPVAVDPVALDRSASIQRMDFETPDAAIEFAKVEVPVPDPDPAPVAQVVTREAITEETVLAEAIPTRIVAEEKPEPLFAGSFESGDLGAWVPKT